MGRHASADAFAKTRSLYGGCTNNSGAPLAIIAAGTGDNTAVTGATINRVDGNSLAHSAKVSLIGLAALANTETLSVAIEEQQSADGSSWDTATVVEATTVVATGTGSNENFVREFDVDLEGKKQYVRYNFTPNLSAGATDTAIVASCVSLGGYDVTPRSDSVV